jgi:hypothetical protein
MAFRLGSGQSLRLRDRFRQHWLEHLTPQDREPWQPHVTIQNKVQPTVARVSHHAVAASFTPYEVMATGVALWIYCDDLWQAAGTFAFATSSS